tara:strand:- start:257 stop:460 length:204 start_codon:yes stop_codon:yes gene_type:complete
MYLKKLLIILILFLPSVKAYAYIDPGTGSFILQAIIGAIAAIGAYVTLYWRKFKNFIDKIFKTKKKD